MTDTETPKPKIYRARLKPDEMIKLGWYEGMIDQWGFIKSILKAKKLPDWCFEDQTPFRMDVEKDGTILLEFGS